jgi:hypothetical protein
MTEQHPDDPDRQHPQGSRRRSIAIGVLGAVAGVAGGAIIASAVTAGAATTGSGSTSSSAVSSTGSASSGGSTSSGSSTSGSTNPTNANPPAYHVPSKSGTVTAVGSSSVTIKSSAGTVTYAVTSASDIDKNGEAQLSDLAVGDAVTFDTTTSNGQTIIDKLHAGDEAKDRPAGPPAGAPAGSNGSSTTN